MSSKKEEFVSEAEEILNSAQEFLLNLQENLEDPPPDDINALFRCFHTLKGISGLFGYDSLQKLSHTLENILDDIRLGKQPLNEATIAFLFKYGDILRKMISNPEKYEDISDMLEEIEEFRKGSEDAGTAAPGEETISDEILRVLSEYEEHRLRENIKKGKTIFSIKTTYPLADFDTELRSLTERIKKFGELISTLPTSEDIPEGHIGFNLLLATSRPQNEIEKEINTPLSVIHKGHREASRKKPAQPQKPATQAMETSLRSATTTVRVDIEKIDSILSSLGELSLIKGAINRIESELIDYFGHSSLIFDIHRINQTLSRRLLELQSLVLEIRMVPIGQIFSRLGQIIRRYSRETDKPVQIHVYGEETEIDKFIAEEVVDALMHIVRNSIDHGIESRQERLNAGKPEVASITLKAYQKGNHVIIEITDDGKGIDTERIRKKAIEKGLISEDARPDRSELIDLIFQPGFSTKDSVSEISGRGVGMDVVRDRLSSVGGFVEVRTEPGKFTTFFLTLPITLAIIKALIIKVGEYTMALPMTSISEIVLIDRDSVQSIEGNPVYNLRDEPLPLINLNRYFETSSKGSSYVVVAGIGSKRIGLVIDDILRSEDIVIKSLGSYLEGIKGFAGAAEIGKHDVVLVIDIESIIEETMRKQTRIGYTNV
ncbi:MAG TPA: chemotaxis protein CheA [Nitrospirae bacterium]|nr:chemotaxis protein CheA [Nitrospirota bacterium]